MSKEQVGDLIDMYNDERKENKRLKENEKEIAKKWFLIGLSHSIILFDPGKKDFKKLFDELWENEKKKEGQQTPIKCEWCSSIIPPFIKLKEGNGFICKRCYESIKEG